MSKLTKTQRGYFAEFAKNDLSNFLFPILAEQGVTMNAEVAEKLMAMINLDEYAEIVGTKFLELVDFKTIKRVDKIMKSDEFIKVMNASYEVSDAVHEERIRILSALLPEEEGQTEE